MKEKLLSAIRETVCQGCPAFIREEDTGYVEYACDANGWDFEIDNDPADDGKFVICNHRVKFEEGGF